MPQTLQARTISLRTLELEFGLQLTEDPQFFREWQDDLPAITPEECQRLERVKASYSNLMKYPPLLEDTVKMVVLSPLLDLAGFYLSPLHVKSEASVEITATDRGLSIRGELDVLVLLDRLWVMAIESKKAAFSLDAGRAQLLAYMLANPHTDQPCFGLLTNGSSFRFLKLVQQPAPQYGLSRLFDLFNPGNELSIVLSILKQLGQLAEQPHTLN